MRNADGSDTLRATVWYPAASGARTVSVDLGPAEAPYMSLGRVATDAAFASEDRYPVVLYSHGFNGSARTTAWFGMALASAGYGVIAVDHPGNNLEAVATPGGSLLWWLRAGDLAAALDAVTHDPVLGGHLDAERVGVAGFSMGGLTAMMSLGAIFDGRLYDDYCAAHPACSVCPPAEALPLFDPQHPLYPEPLKSEIRRMSEDRKIPSAKAGFVMAPAILGLRPDSLSAIEVPVTFIVGSEDVTASPEVGAALGASLIPHARHIVIPGANHDSFINLCSPAGAAANYLQCTVATEQALAHDMALESALTLFDSALKTPVRR